jgi:hypothetical protein
MNMKNKKSNSKSSSSKAFKSGFLTGLASPLLFLFPLQRPLKADDAASYMQETWATVGKSLQIAAGQDGRTKKRPPKR